MKGQITAQFHVVGHLIDSGLLSEVLEAVHATGSTSHVRKLDIGRERGDESELILEVATPNQDVYERLSDDLLSLGLSETHTDNVELSKVEMAGTAPEGFYSTTNLATEVRVGGKWVRVEDQRMDATVVVDDGRARCVKIRDLTVGQLVVLRHRGVRITTHTPRKQDARKFAFMQGGVSSERRLAAQVEDVVRVWKQVRQDGKKVVLVAGPVVIHVGAAQVLASILRSGQVDGLLSGNALAVHDCEASIFGTSLGVELATGVPAVHGHMHHMRAINRVRRAGSLANAVEQGVLKSGVMRACLEAGVAFCLAGSIRDDGPLPDTEMDLIKAQADYAEILKGAGLVVVLGSMLHGIGTGNMVAADVMTVCVDIHPAVVAKLSDRGSAQSQGIVTDVGAFLTVLASHLDVAVD